jgi:hypothetical protein
MHKTVVLGPHVAELNVKVCSIDPVLIDKLGDAAEEFGALFWDVGSCPNCVRPDILKNVVVECV